MTDHDPARALFRTVGPNPGAALPEDSLAISNTPKKVYTCPKCDWSTKVKWQMNMHNKFPSPECERIARKKARKWANG